MAPVDLRLLPGYQVHVLSNILGEGLDIEGEQVLGDDLLGQGLGILNCHYQWVTLYHLLDDPQMSPML